MKSRASKNYLFKTKGIIGSTTVYFKKLHYLGNKTYYHEFLVWTKDDGSQVIIRGGPLGSGGGSGGGSGSLGFGEPGTGDNVPFAKIAVISRSFPSYFRDFEGSAVDPQDVVMTGSDGMLQPRVWRMLLAAKQINELNIPYAAGGPNSNSVVTTLLQAAGLPQPKGNGLDGPYPAPGADMSLLYGKYSAGQGYEELFGNVAERGEKGHRPHGA